jgi:hypothetical protein
MTRYERETIRWVKEQESILPPRYLMEIITGMNQRWRIIPGLEAKRYFPAGYCSAEAAKWCLRHHPGQYFVCDERETRQLWTLFEREMLMNGHNDDSSTAKNADLYLMRKRDTKRPMGVYTKVEAWPAEGLLASTPIVTIEQVHGDQTVDTLTLCMEEALDLARAISTAAEGANSGSISRRL